MSASSCSVLTQLLSSLRHKIAIQRATPPNMKNHNLRNLCGPAHLAQGTMPLLPKMRHEHSNMQPPFEPVGLLGLLCRPHRHLGGTPTAKIESSKRHPPKASANMASAFFSSFAIFPLDMSRIRLKAFAAQHTENVQTLLTDQASNSESLSNKCFLRAATLSAGCANTAKKPGRIWPD